MSEHIKDFLTGATVLAAIGFIGWLSVVFLGETGPFILGFAVIGGVLCKLLGSVIRE